MYVAGVRDVYVRCRNLGICKSIKDFSANVVGTREDYVSNCLRGNDTQDRQYNCPSWVGGAITKNLRRIVSDIDGQPARYIVELINLVEQYDQSARLLRR